MRVLGLLGMVAAVGWSGTLAQGAPPMPPGRGADVVASKCLTCHGSDLMRQQRLTRAGWLREVDKMARWGAVLTESERDLAADYLTTNFGPSSGAAPPLSATGEGAAVFRRSCLGCHGADLVEQQRLGRAAWVRELDKMIRWGALVRAEDNDDREKDLLIDYLAGRFRPRTPQ